MSAVLYKLVSRLPEVRRESALLQVIIDCKLILHGLIQDHLVNLAARLFAYPLLENCALYEG